MIVNDLEQSENQRLPLKPSVTILSDRGVI